MALIPLLTILTSLSIGAYGSYVNQMVFPDVSTFYSGPEPDYSRFPLSVYDRDFVTFRLRACEEGRILVHATKHAHPRDSDVTATEIAMGVSDNKMIIVREPKEGPEIMNATTETPVLDCGELRQFWISWRNRTLQIGRGPIFQQQILLDMKKPNARFTNIDMLFFATTNGQTGVWQLDDNAGLFSMLRTSTSMDFPYFWKSVEHHDSGFVFSVRALHTAKIGLAAIPGQPDYTLVLGKDNGNTSVLMKGEDIVDIYDEADQVSITEYRPYWLTWHGGLIEAGIGRQPGQLAILDYKDSYFTNVGHVGLATGSGANGEWIIKQDTENEIIVSTPLKSGLQEYDFYISAPRSRFVQFYVAACSDASIIFTTDIGFANDNSIFVTLGADNNTKTTIGTGYSPDIDEYPNKGLLKCATPLPFWASWRTGQLRVGSGALVDADTILSFTHGVVSSIMATGFSNERRTKSADFMVADTYGDELGFFAPPGMSFGSVWVTTRGEYFRVFDIMQCGSSQILLAETQNDITNDRYQVIFSTDGKQVTLQRGQTTRTLDLSRALQCMEKRTFWLSWYGNQVKLGEGHRYSDQHMVELSAGQPYTVNAITMANTGGQAAEWEIDMEKDNILSIKMPKDGTNSAIRWFRLYEHVKWMYVGLANENQARMVLSSWYRDSGAITHEISFCEDGGNSIIARKGEEVIAKKNLTTVWDKVNLRYFWISWEEEGGFVFIGESKFRGQNVLLKIPYTLDEKTAALGFYHEQLGDVEWELHNSFGSEATIFTDPNAPNMNWVKMSHNMNSIVYGVETCTVASLVLSDRMYVAEGESYTLNLTNDVTYIAKGGRSQVWTKTPSLLTCDTEQFFWLSWYGGTVSIGSGQDIGVKVLLTWHDALPSAVNAFTVSSGSSSAKWRLGLMGALAPRPPSPEPSPNAGLSGGAIAGIVIGCLLLVAIVIFIVLAVVRGLPRPLQRLFSTGGGSGANDQSFHNPISHEPPQY